MINHLPVLKLGELLGPQAEFEDKFGGLPFGLPPSMWPTCSACGKHQTLLAQLRHDAVRLDLGRDGRVLHVFQCNHDPGMCETWRGGSGANACFVVEPEDLTDDLTPWPETKPTIEREARIAGWRALDDGLTDAQAELFFDADRLFSLPEEVFSRPPNSSRLGGVPLWIQSPDEAPGPPWAFIGQLDGSYSFLEAPSRPMDGVYEDPSHRDGRTHFAEGPNFGSGIAYLFLDRSASPPRGWFFWQC